MSFSTKADQLTGLLMQAEELLRAGAMCVSAVVPMGNEYLSWRKRGAEWLLVVVDCHEAEHPLRQSSLSRRVMAAAVLDVLFDALLEQRQNVEREVHKATLEVACVIDRMRVALDTSGTGGGE